MVALPARRQAGSPLPAEDSRRGSRLTASRIRALSCTEQSMVAVRRNVTHHLDHTLVGGQPW
ncbi:MAG: hypothetical protein IAE81_09130 [Caldilineaceae bacterium]|nr:hypothetical protein [Caldilineaceae bacterium]